eukprot:TRINITY_DN10017_c0_g1_i3.p1 TRINITY_DN10017_c0_g1~~TRINITY_DN10017_c0_g1_i3.p1  ORF type:complete len:504 (+),score=27.41 TRINITY_DN10017_c0_g1_i3:23-1534(+)
MLNVDYALLFSVSLILRYGVSLWPYSGEGKPPMHGDYEAQRHWQEITINLPLDQWYNHTQDNDLLYWGLDYPPLTAYHSYLVGQVAHRVNSSFTELHQSRGIESPDHKLFMRLSVIVADLLILFPAIRFFCGSSLSATALLLAIYPGLILIDHGHFQYNGISLGLFVISVAAVIRNCDVLGSIAFCLALNYKQMELYHALPFFFYLLGKCLHQPSFLRKISKLFVIGVSVIGTFVAVWLPFFLAGPYTTLQVVRRIFPVDRGLYEDKVANFWCTIDIIFKLKQNLDTSQIGLLCIAATLLLSLPSNLHVLRYPTPRNFVMSLLNTSLVFFLFSFHVHEKTILLVAIPAILATSVLDKKSAFQRYWLPWFLILTVFSMVPLLVKDGLLLPTIASTVFFCIMYGNLDQMVSTSSSPLNERMSSPLPVEPNSFWIQLLGFSQVVSLCGACLLTLLHEVYPPPARYPYLWPTLICAYSSLHFLLFLLAFHVIQFSSGVTVSFSKKKL